MRATEILAHFDLALGTASKSTVLRAWYLSDDGGTIEARDALKIFSRNRPEYHTTMPLDIALVRLGCVVAELGK